MKLSCEIVKDLLPLYHDDVCSNESRNVVHDHLQECEDCKKYYESMRSEFIPNYTEKAEEKVKSDFLKGVRRKLKQKNIIISVVSALSAIAILLGAFSVVFHYQMPISYEAGLLSVNKAEDGVIDILFRGDDYYGSYAFIKTIKKEGIEQNNAYIYYTDSIWTKYFSRPRNTEGYQFSIGNGIMIDYDKNGDAVQFERDIPITSVYYLTGDYKDLLQLTDEEFAKATQNATLIWEE